MRIKLLFIYLLTAGFIISCSSNRPLSGDSQSSKVENVQFSQEEDLVTITYDLISDSDDARFNVQLLLEYENGQLIELNSGSVEGEVGSNILPGKEKKIIWNVLEDYPNGLQSDQIQFAVNVWQPTTSNHPNRKWIYIATGALVLGAGMSAAMIYNNGGGGSGDSAGLPAPPSRPGS